MSTSAGTSMILESIVNEEETNTFSENETNPPNDSSLDDNLQLPGQSQLFRGEFTIPLPAVTQQYQGPHWFENDVSNNIFVPKFGYRMNCDFLTSMLLTIYVIYT